MSLTKFQAQVTDKEFLNERYCYVRLELIKPHRLEFVAGQYIILTIPGQEHRKIYSIASEPEMNHALELLIVLIPEGVGSEYIGNLEIGDKVEFLGPAGQFQIESNDASELVLVATGAGIAPFRSMILDLLQCQGDRRPIKLFWGLRYTSDLFWTEFFQQLTVEYDNFSFELILSQPPDEWTLSRGYVTDLLSAFQTNTDKVSFYLCGGGGMIKGVSEYLAGRGVDKANIYYEQFY